MENRVYYIVYDDEGKGVIFQDTGMDEPYTEINTAEKLKEFTETVVHIANRLKKEGKISRTQNEKAKECIKSIINGVEEEKKEEFNQEKREESFQNKEKNPEKDDLGEKGEIMNEIMREVQLQREIENAKKETGIKLNEFEIEALHKHDKICKSAALSYIMAEMNSTNIVAAEATLATMLSKREQINTKQF